MRISMRLSNPSRLSDPQIMASKAVEEAQTYIAYGRTDQAVEVLNDALAEGLTSVALNHVPTRVLRRVGAVRRSG